MKTMQDVFTEYGADYNATMVRFGGNETLYLRILNKFPDDESMRNLDTAIAAGDMGAAFAAAHTLKGVAGNLGLSPLFKAVCTIVEPLRARDENCNYAERYTIVQAEYQKAERFLEELKGVTP